MAATVTQAAAPVAALPPLDPASEAGRATAARLSEVFADVREAIATRNAQAAADRRPA